MVLDRKLQLELLTKIAECYPFAWDDYERNTESDEYYKCAINLHYLSGHGLLTEKSTSAKPNTTGDGGGRLFIKSPAITEKGLDFLQNDGGLSAILGVVTVRFEADTIRTILQLKVDQSDLSPADKQKLRSVLQELPAENIKHLSTKIVDMGWDGLGSLMSLIQSSVF
ncbi:hypothetical protein B9T36_00740 [Acinetobacter sp. ANC 4204]|uniref:hypothetical protein n=1 Tax=Acinetobacter sp. ANC 4204 TaxID=1977884 RepID=UPI000A33E27A|nr:hypothetical protein [Acinetobacter sp. ANC 4204]OTG60974.1 hypothetical protein B9T36_00740 [Acinetobacter sp. ANC 4204]